jgi:ABC-type phosphate/phosphonate transport system permease subunit
MAAAGLQWPSFWPMQWQTVATAVLGAAVCWFVLIWACKTPKELELLVFIQT